ncbi:MAG: hypothetical protein QOI75_6897 [Pseudonocardiales bacterium]|nr:hypothetical protein [Pseudonocardiales bacterium]
MAVTVWCTVLTVKHSAADTFLSGGDLLDPLAFPVLGGREGITTRDLGSGGWNEALRRNNIR